MIEIKKISKSFGEHVIFKDLNLNIEKGEFVVFCGPSGCGKTTLLNIIGGLERIDEGNLIIDGTDISKKRPKKEYYLTKVGFLFQNFAILENKTVKENIELVQTKARTGITVGEALEKVGLKDKENEKVYKLSGGEQQRVAVARLLFKRCDIILADEPTGSLDRANGDNIMSLLHMLNDMGKTVVLVTHDERIIESEKRVIRLQREDNTEK